MNILWLHDNIEDHKELHIQLENFEKSIIDFTDGQSCIDFLKNSSQQNENRPSILVALNRIARQIVPEIHPETILISVIVFCTQNDNKIRWINKYKKIRGIYVKPKELIEGLRQLIRLSNKVKPFPCQLILLNDQQDKNMMKQFYQIDSSLIIFKYIHSCVKYFQSVSSDRPLILISTNALGRLAIPEVHSNEQLNAVFIFYKNVKEKIRWANKYEKIKSVTTDIKDLSNDIRNEGLCISTLPWHIVCLDDHNDKKLYDRLYELDPCLITFDQMKLCENYLKFVSTVQISNKPILFIAVNGLGRQFVPEVHSNNQLHAFYIYVYPFDQRIKWTTKYNKIKHVSTDLNQLIKCIEDDVSVLTKKIDDIPTSIQRSGTRESLGTYIICWLDSNTKEINEFYQQWLNKLNGISSSTKLFYDIDEFADYLTDVEHENIFLIVSIDLIQNIIPLLQDIPQLYIIYIYSNKTNKEINENCKNYGKVKGIYSEIGDICFLLEEDIKQLNNNSISVSFLKSSNSNKSTNLNQLNASFMYSQLLKEILLEINYDETSITQFIRFCRAELYENNQQQKIVDDFEKDYHKHSPIWWYSKESFIYSMLNRALRTFDIGITVIMGFFIRDLHCQIEQLHHKQFYHRNSQVFMVYRGQGMFPEDFKQFLNSRGGIISFNNFLSTSYDRSVSLKFAYKSQKLYDYIGVLFQVEIDPSISSTPFASIEDLSYFKREEEILFSTHTVFRIGNIQSLDDSQRLFEVNLNLTGGENDEELQILKQHIEKDIGGSDGSQRLGALMLEIGQYDKALDFYEELLRSTHSSINQITHASILNQLGAAYSRKGEFSQALSRYKEALDIKLTYLPYTDSSLSTIYSNIGSVLRNQNQLTEALEYMKHALKIEQDADQMDEIKLASYQNNIGLVLTDQRRYNEALEHYERALEIHKRILPSNHPNLAISYNNIGTIYNEMSQYEKALEYYQKSLDIMQKSLPPNHPDLATLYNNIGTIYNELKDYSRALSYYEKSLEIIQKVLPSNHPSLALSYHNLSLVYDHLSAGSKALSYTEKAVEIASQIFEASDPRIVSYQETLDKIRTKLQNYN